MDVTVVPIGLLTLLQKLIGDFQDPPKAGIRSDVAHVGFVGRFRSEN